jgi:hypothetical protein
MTTAAHTGTEELAALESRQAELSRTLEALDRDIEHERTAMGQAVAEGRDGSEHRARAREFGEEAEGIRRALPIVEEQIEAARKRRRAKEIAAARSVEDRQVAAAVEALAKADKALRSWITAELIPLMDKVEAASDAASSAEKTHRRLTGAPTPPQFRVYNEGSRHYGALYRLAELLKGYAANKPYLFGVSITTEPVEETEEVGLALRSHTPAAANPAAFR